MRLWRLARGLYPALDGDGARRYGGRWNSPGVAVVYTATSLPLAVLEMLVHVDTDTAPRDLIAFEIDAPGIEWPASSPTGIVASEAEASGAAAPASLVDPSELPSGWAQAVSCPACRALGDAWAMRGETLALAVPSAVIPSETCVLLNPHHPAMAGVRIVRETAFAFDTRLLG